MSETELIVLFVFLAIGGICYLIQGPRPSSDLHDTQKGDDVPVLGLSARKYKLKGPCHAQLVRQSGLIYRDMGAFRSVEEAAIEVERSFNRAKIEMLRITHEDDVSLAMYRKFYSLTGRAEGKKLAGAIFEAAPAAGLERLSVSVREISGETVFLNYHCENCGVTNAIETEYNPNDYSAVCCTSCQYVFASFSEFKSACKAQAEILTKGP